MRELYIVKKGDTLWGISKKYNIDIQNLIDTNQLYGRKKNLLHIGQEILLTGSSSSGFDTKLTILIFDLKWETIPDARLLLEYDGQSHLVESDDKGVVNDIYIKDAMKGIKVSFFTIKNEFTVIAYHKVLPFGKKVLKLNSRAMVLKGKTHQLNGVQRIDTKTIEKELKSANKEKKDSHAQDRREIESRIEAGLPAIIVAAIYSEENLYLHPDNEKYRKVIISAAKKYKLAPQALAAKINAEAGTKKGSQEWNADAKASGSSAVGLTQFLKGTWYEMCVSSKYKDTLLQQYVRKNRLISNFQENMSIKDISDRDKSKLSALGTNPELSVDTAAAYARANINGMEDSYPKITQLDSADLAKVSYVAHHDGFTGFSRIIEATNQGGWSKLVKQVSPDDANSKKIKSYKERFNDGDSAYRWWLCTEYTDSKINVNRYTLSSKTGQKFKEPKTMEEIIVFLGGKALVKPNQAFEKQKLNSNDDLLKENLNIILTSLSDNKVKANVNYHVKSIYGVKSHSTGINGSEVLRVKKGDLLEIIFNNKVLQKISVSKDKEEFKINFPSMESDKNNSNNENTFDILRFNGWRNPLSGVCQIRRFGYNSLPLQANSIKYLEKNLKEATGVASRFNRNSYRSSGVHQGIDLEADNDTNIYPVCVGTIAKVILAYPGYGKTLILECNVNDLPESKRASVKNLGSIYFIYAHLNSICVTEGQIIDDLSRPIGKTGNTGNAGGMKKIEEGSHLHFEVRTEINKSMGKSGLSYRLDPFPWIENCKTIENGVHLGR
ncbi:LysM peptidoglycan-binding domain-containing protein [Acinetobacter sp.]|uniref:LysM peptidoglycan-binding domain-containing protein n=1 Tax=Acinetobacter sp. TaxID=472 RepID=UPI0035B09E0B